MRRARKKELEQDSADDADYFNLGGADFESDVEWGKYIELRPNDDNLVETYFEHFFLRTKGHAKLIDEFYSSRRSPY